MLKSMKVILNTTFESSSSRTPEFISAARLLRLDLGKLFKKAGMKRFAFHEGHFYVTVFIENKDGKIFYISFGDFRFFKGEGYIRTAKSFEDYTGGPNWSLNMDANFEEKLLKVIA
jgi:hypothetical protein